MYICTDNHLTIMKLEVKREKYRKTTSFITITVVGIVCIICLAGVLLWHPKPKLEGEPVSMSTTQDTPVYIYDSEGRLVESDRIIPEGTDLTIIAEFAEYKWCVEDEAGNRFAINKAHLFGDPSQMKAINPSYSHVYRGRTLNGRKLADIKEEAGDYIYAAVDSGHYVFPQIVLAEGSKRYKGVFVRVDENGTITYTNNISSPHSNLYAKLPLFDRIASMNIFNKFIPFNKDADMEAYYTFSLEKVGTGIKDFFVNIGLYILLFFAGLFIAAISIIATFCAGNFFFQSFARITGVKNFVITILEYLYMIPSTYIILLSLFYTFNDIWIILAAFVMGILSAMTFFVEKFSIRDARCPKCLRLNTIDVEEVTYSNRSDIEAHRGDGWALNKEQDVDTVRVINHYIVKTHSECSHCHHCEENSREYDKTGEWKNIEGVACPRCHKLSLRATAKVTESTIRYATYTNTKTGNLNYKGENIFTGDRMFESKDKRTTYGYYTGHCIYSKWVLCNECGYSHNVKERYEPDSSSEKLYEENYKTKWKTKHGLFD